MFIVVWSEKATNEWIKLNVKVLPFVTILLPF